MEIRVGMRAATANLERCTVAELCFPAIGINGGKIYHCFAKWAVDRQDMMNPVMNEHKVVGRRL